MINEGIKRSASLEEDPNEFRKILERQLIEYALGLNPNIEVEINPLTHVLLDEGKVSTRSEDSSNGLRFVFKYNGEEQGFTDQDVNDKTLGMAEKVLTDFYRGIHRA